MFSVPYTVALALMTGKVDLAAFHDKGVDDPRVLALSDRTTVTDDPLSDFPIHFPGEVRLTLRDVGLLAEITAPTQELANAICSNTRISVLHAPYPGQLATGGNFAIPLNPPESPIGPVFRFSLYHLMEVDSPVELFPVRVVEC